MKIAALSDLHGHRPPVPRADLVLISGDIAPGMDENPFAQLNWMRDVFKPYLEAIPGEVYAVPGNHDFWAESRCSDALADLDLPWTLLIDEGAQVLGPEKLTIWGSPWHLPCFGAFNADEHKIHMALDMIPSGVDVLMLHGPAYGYGDIVRGAGHVGSTSILEAIRELKPRLVTTGHIHEAKGEWDIGPSHLVNVSVLNDQYELTYPVWTGELAPRTRRRAA